LFIIHYIKAGRHIESKDTSRYQAIAETNPATQPHPTNAIQPHPKTSFFAKALLHRYNLP